MSHVLRFSQLSLPRQALVRLCQRMNFGQIQKLRVQDGDPAFDPSHVVLIDEKLDSNEAPRPESDVPDFVLPAELFRLFARFDEMNDGMIERLEVRAGIPRRVIYESVVPDLFPMDNNTRAR
jgi:hypothetical protein